MQSYRRLLSCFSSHCKDADDNIEINDSDRQLSLSPTAAGGRQQQFNLTGTSGRSSTCRRRRDRCPKCRGLLPDQKQQRSADLPASQHPQPVLIPIRFRQRIRKSALPEVKEDSGCYEQFQPAKTEPSQQFEDSGIGLSSYSHSPALPQPPQPQQQMPQKPAAVVGSSGSSSSSDILIAQLSERTKCVPRLPNRQAPFDAESQRRFLAAKQSLSCEMSGRRRNLRIDKN